MRIGSVTSALFGQRRRCRSTQRDRQLVGARQLLQMTQGEVLEKHRRRAVHQGTAESLSAADDIDQATFMERLQHSADSDTTNLLDLGATDRLAIGNDRERLERGGGEPLRARRELRA